MNKRCESRYSWLFALRQLFPFFFKASPVMFFAVCGVGIFSSILYVLDTIAVQWMTDGATKLYQGEIILGHAVGYILIFGCVKLLQQANNGVDNYLAEHWQTMMKDRLQSRLNMKCARLDPILYEDTEFIGNLEKCSEGIESCVSLAGVSLLIVTNSVPYIIFMSVYLFCVNPVLVFTILLIFVPLLINHLFTHKLYTKLEDDVSPLRRQCDHYEKCMCDRQYVKDTRASGAYKYFHTIYTDCLSRLVTLNQKIQNRVCKRNALSKTLTLVGYVSVLGLLFVSAINRKITVGEFSAVFYSLSTLIGLLEELIERHIGSLARSLGTVNNYFSVINLQEQENNGINGAGNIKIEHVCFQYPHSESRALNDISLEIRPGEKIAIVGQNGSGKTTLVKLLLGIYSPTTGRIIREGKPGDGISAVFQDYQKYPFTLEKNVRISDIKQSDKEIAPILQKMEINTAGEAFPQGLDTVLAREFGGVDISIGQWQRIANARGYYRACHMIALDEPTAAIDPLEEHRLFSAFMELAQNKTSIIVTHRLGAARMADRIVVLRNGSVDSIGTHDELMQLGGLYKTIFESQAKWYYEPDPDRT